jgi:hypothetical protein
LLVRVFFTGDVYQETAVRELSCGFFDFDLITEISKALRKPRRCPFVIQAQKIYGTEFLIGHRVADQVISGS